MVVHKGTVTIRTKRLLLRRFAPKDGSAMYENILSDKGIGQYLRRTGYTKAEACAILQSIIGNYGSSFFYHWAVEYKGEVIGSVSVREIATEDRRGEIGWNISSAHSGKGFASEAAYAVLDFMFEGVGLERLQAVCAAGNIPSRRVMEKLGMTQEGVLRNYFVAHDGKREDCVLYAILACEHRKN